MLVYYLLCVIYDALFHSLLLIEALCRKIGHLEVLSLLLTLYRPIPIPIISLPPPLLLLQQNPTHNNV
jgi:hypothetical protein